MPRELYDRCTQMILLGVHGGRCCTPASATVRPSSSRSASPSTVPQQGLPLAITWRRSTRGPCSTAGRGNGAVIMLGASSQADTADPALPVRWCRPLEGEAAEGRCGGGSFQHVEPDVDVAGAARILVVRQRRARNAAVGAAQSADHLQVVCAEGLPEDLAVLAVPALEHEVVPALLEELHRLLVAGDVLRARHIALVEDARVIRLPVDLIEAVAQRAGGEQHHAPIAARDGLGDHLAALQVVLGAAVLARADRDDLLAA